MSLWKIAWRSVQQRGVASCLTTFSMALGVMMVVCVLSIYGIVSEQFKSSSNLGYNMLVGAKGGKLQLTLNSVYYLSEPVENISYEYYLEFFDKEVRDKHLKESFRYQAHEAVWETMALSNDKGLDPLGLGAIAEQAAMEALDNSQQQFDLQLNREGQFGQFIDFAIPVCLGDYFGRFRVVGTTPEFFERLVTDPALDRKYGFAQGRNFKVWSPEHQYFEAVVGATVAREMDVSLGQVINPAHGDPEGHGHAQGFTVVGILEPSGKPNDRAVFINMEGFFLMADHAKPIDPPDVLDGELEGELLDEPPPESSAIEQATANSRPELLPLEQREVTAMLVRTVSPFVTPAMQNLINEDKEAQAVLPVKEIYDLMDLIVQPVQQLLLAMTAMNCLVSGVGILVSIYNSMSDRKHEIAVMRALGASRNAVMSIILLEAVFLALGGGGLGWLMGHSLNYALAPRIEAQTGVQLTFLSLAPPIDIFEPLGIQPKQWGVNVPVLALLAWVVGGVLFGYSGFVLSLGALKRGGERFWSAILARRAVLFWWFFGLVLIIAGTLGYVLGVGDAVSSELLLIPALMVLAILVGFFPAIEGYRTDVSQSLGK